MIILSIDLGEVKTGIACCDKNETIAFPITTIIETNNKNLLQKIIQQIIKQKAQMIVIGNPVNMNGSCSLRSQKCKKFANKLKNATNLPVVLWDERQTTLLAQRIMIHSCTKKNKKKKLVDQIAATIILENYLKFKQNKHLS